MKKVQMIVVFYVRKAGNNNKKVHTMSTYSVQGGFMNWGHREYGHIWIKFVDVQAKILQEDKLQDEL